MSTYAIGDIQGCFESLQQLLDKIQFSASRDQLWLLGDLINRGPDSLGTLRFAKSLGDSAVVVLGNHDLHLLAVATGARKANKKDTLDEILEAKDREELLHWLRQQKLLHYCKKLKTVAVHAGIPPIWSLKFARKLATEVESTLQSKHYTSFLRSMYGNTPDIWHDKLKGYDRLRLITNYFTRMRFCSTKGQLELSTKTGPDQAPKGFAPWFSHTNPSMENTRIVFGHWASLMGQTENKQAIGLDTGCVWGNKLTALCLESGESFSVCC